MRHKHALVLFPLLFAGCAPGTMGGVESTHETEIASTPILDMLGPGSTLLIQLDQPIGLNTSAITLRQFTATVLEPVHSADGVLIPMGAELEGTITGYFAEPEKHPQLVAVDFDRLRIGKVSYDVDAVVTDVHLARTENGSSGDFALRATVTSPAATIPGTIIEDAETFFVEGEAPGLASGTVISLGLDPGYVLPEGARMTVELRSDLPLLAIR